MPVLSQLKMSSGDMSFSDKLYLVLLKGTIIFPHQAHELGDCTW